MLYQWEVGRTPIDVVMATYFEAYQPALDEPARAFATELAGGVVRHASEIDPLIESTAEHWRFSRLAVIDRLIMRVAVYELLFARDTPPAVAIDEALDLARRYSGEEAVKFVNGVLDGIRRKLAGDHA
jgi:N utilization substance protein B